MKNVTIMMRAAGSIAGLAIFAVAQSTTASAVPERAVGGAAPILISDQPLFSPDDRFAQISPLYSSGAGRVSGSGYWYAPGSGPRCEMKMKRLAGRLYQTCE